MKKAIATFLLKLLGWKTSIEVNNGLKKCVMIAAPHTSNWDFPFSVLTFWKHDIDFKFFIKDSYTKSILGGIFNAMGAIGVDRSKGGNLVEFASNLLKEKDELVILVPAEGTRSYVEKWKTGFYHIAKNAGVPIALGYLDFDKKLAGVGPLFNPTDNIDADFKIIEDFYKDITGKNPELYNPNIYPKN
jgi:1-acyl-sn-glycerol-3-phosphate acyltransferase